MATKKTGNTRVLTVRKEGSKRNLWRYLCQRSAYVHPEVMGAWEKVIVTKGKTAYKAIPVMVQEATASRRGRHKRGSHVKTVYKNRK